MRFSKQASDTLPRVALLSWMRSQTSLNERVDVRMEEVEGDVGTLKEEVVELRNEFTLGAEGVLPRE